MKHFVLILLSFTPFVSKSQKELKVGEIAPEILFQKSYTSNYVIPKGKVIFIDFWATWCGPCIASLIEHNELVKKYSNKIEFIAITDTTSRKVPEFIMQTKLKHKFLIDNDTQTFSKFGVNGIPYGFLIDENKKIVWAGRSRDFNEKMILQFFAKQQIEKYNDKGFDKSRYSYDTSKKKVFELKITNQKLLNSHATTLKGRDNDNDKGNYSNAPEFEGSLTVINYSLEKFTNRTQLYFANKVLTCDLKQNVGFDFIKINFSNFEEMNLQLSKEYGIQFVERK